MAHILGLVFEGIIEFGFGEINKFSQIAATAKAHLQFYFDLALTKISEL